MRILFAAGGTGGHLSPAINMAGALMRKDPPGEAFFLASGRDVERHFLDGSSFPVVSLFPDSLSRPSPANPLPWLRALFRARRAVREFRPHAVVATGGYVTLPVIGAVFLSGIPFYLLEQNALPGRATRLALPFARRVFCHYDEAAGLLGRRALAPGSPLSAACSEGAAAVKGDERRRKPKAEARAFFGLDRDRRTLLVAGGSLGARGLNELVFKNVGAFNEKHQVLHVTGERDCARAEKIYRESGVAAKVFPFCRQMDRAYAAADLILCRAGGMTVAETCAVGLPSVFVPYPWHRDGHQFYNAGLVEAAGGGVIIEERQATPERFCRHVTGLLEDGARLESMSESSRILGKPRAAERIIETIGEDLGRGVLDVA